MYEKYWVFTVALAESEDIKVPIQFYYDEDGYIAKILAMKTLQKNEYAKYGELYSRISEYDTIFIHIIKEIIPNHKKIEIYHNELKINYLCSLLNEKDELYKEVI